MKLLIKTANSMHRPAVDMLRVCLFLIFLSSVTLLFCSMLGGSEMQAELSFFLPEITEYIIISFIISLGGAFLLDIECEREKKDQ